MTYATVLDIANPSDRDRAALALSNARIVGHAVANVYVLGAHPAARVVRHVNLIKGRPPDQVGSITTTRDLVPELFDWSRLPSGLEPETVLGLMDALWALGPFGFRGPAAAHL